MDIAVYTLTSPLHDEASVNVTSKAFIGEIEASLGSRLTIKGKDFSGYGSHDLDIIYVRTGGTEGLFKEVFSQIDGPVLLLTSGKSNSLAASMEILSYLRQQGRKGEIIHGQPRYIAERISILAKVSSARKALDGLNLGIVGQPSDWLISSNADKEAVKSKLGINLKEIDIEELVNEIKSAETSCTDKRTQTLCASVPEGIRKYLDGYRLRLVSSLTGTVFSLLSTLSFSRNSQHHPDRTYSE